ncbi:MAG: hypothetical protein ACRC7D_01680 [Aeromonas popoffii]|uniref:hypothetical protein n=1 Tax=Aeromonas popoffii TaxID=70856 RepID=UPI003F3B0DC2
MLLIPFAIKTATGEVVSVDDVERGLRCGCHCPSCEARLVARKGEQYAHNFAHHAASKQDCSYAFETSIRLMLLAKLAMVETLHTPGHSIVFEGDIHRIADGRSDIPVKYVPQTATQSTPAGLYQLVEQGDYQLAIHLPAAHDPDDWSPIWLGQFIAQHPKTGVLAVRYSQFRIHMLEESRPADLDTISWMLSILSQHADCLRWMYHPREESRRSKLQQLAEQKRLEEEALRLREEQKREELRQREAALRAARLKQQEIERQQRQAELEKLRARNAALLGQSTLGSPPERIPSLSYQRERDRSTMKPIVPPSQPRVPLCKHCRLPMTGAGQDGFCSREFCTNARKHIAGTVLSQRRNDSAQERPVQPLVEVRTANTVIPTPFEHEQETRRVLDKCPKCGGEKGKGDLGWWCDECG